MFLFLIWFGLLLKSLRLFDVCLVFVIIVGIRRLVCLVLRYLRIFLVRIVVAFAELFRPVKGEIFALTVYAVAHVEGNEYYYENAAHDSCTGRTVYSIVCVSRSMWSIGQLLIWQIAISYAEWAFSDEFQNCFVHQNWLFWLFWRLLLYWLIIGWIVLRYLLQLPGRLWHLSLESNRFMVFHFISNFLSI